MSKTIIFCADGTWNRAGSEDDPLNVDTNVYKFFKCLPGNISGLPADQERNYQVGADLVQCAKYINGVGSGVSAIEKVVGGALGIGLIVRIVRGYTYISRQYMPGDNIVLVGFSRGAYTVRALAGMILAKGLLSNNPELDKNEAHKRGMKVWFDYRRDRGETIGDLAVALTNLIDFISTRGASTVGLREIKQIQAVAVWDTVGALGIPLVAETGADSGVRDAFQFANKELDSRVQLGLHALSFHEQRHAFQPCLWVKRDGVKQLRFAGAHSDVGGGYLQTESGLSDIALHWMIDELDHLGVQFDSDRVEALRPDYTAKIHQPWTIDPWRNMDVESRVWPDYIQDHGSMAEWFNANRPA